MIRCCAVELGCQHPPGEPHAYCPFHGSIVAGYPQPLWNPQTGTGAAACHKDDGWEPSGDTKELLRRAQARPAEVRTDG